uniref:Uncharacterized protein n=1 Tax=Anguilla anguilla TaxID=7936 RepID=A0A0E9XA88_ANGAN
MHKLNLANFASHLATLIQVDCIPHRFNSRRGKQPSFLRYFFYQRFSQGMQQCNPALGFFYILANGELFLYVLSNMEAMAVFTPQTD